MGDINCSSPSGDNANVLAELTHFNKSIWITEMNRRGGSSSGTSCIEISYQDYHMGILIELRQALISYQDHHMGILIEFRQALVSYQDYHTFVARRYPAGASRPERRGRRGCLAAA